MGYKDGREPPDGYEWIGDGPGIRLVNPTFCPAGHPVQLTGTTYSPCAEHRGHTGWTCACGQRIFRSSGEYVGELPCIDPNFGQQR